MTIPDIPESIPVGAVTRAPSASAPRAPVAHSGSAKQALARWMDEQIEGQDEFRVSDLGRRAIEAFGSDPEFMKALANELFPSWIRGFARTRVANTRRLQGPDVLVHLGDDLVVTKRGLERREQAVQQRWARWFENVNGRYVSLPFMTKADLVTAATTREIAAESDLVIATLWRELAETLEPGERVHDRFTAEQIEQKKAEIEKRVRTH